MSSLEPRGRLPGDVATVERGRAQGAGREAGTARVHGQALLGVRVPPRSAWLVGSFFPLQGERLERGGGRWPRRASEAKPGCLSRVFGAVWPSCLWFT